MKLTTKALWIPAGILLLIFLGMGILFSRMVISNSETTQASALTRLINSDVHELRTALSLLTATQAPADALIGLEGGDDVLARDLDKRVSGMGLDAVYLTDLKGQPQYSNQQDFPAELGAILGQAARQSGSVNVIYLSGHMIGYAPVIDVDAPMGFVAFSIKIPQELASFVDALLSGNSKFDAVASAGSASERLDKSRLELEASGKAFLTKILMTITLTLVVALALILGVLGTTSRNIVRPIRELLTVFNKMAEGDFTQTVELKSSDEIGQLQVATKATIAQLHGMINDVNAVTVQLSSSAERMEGIAAETDRGVQAQRGETDQVATAMNEMTATVQEVARHAGDAANAASRADSEANNGHHVVNETIKAIRLLADEIEEAASVIHSLEQDSDSIGAVLDVIKGIAEQTNLLALNAAIEAARAGEQGRGFAVVADEVRTLASRTQQSTQEIQEMIERLQAGSQQAVKVMTDSRSRAQAGVSQAAEAGTCLESITGGVTAINDMNTQIASAAEQQSSVAEEINRNVINISQVAERSADGAHQLSAATQELNQLSDTLRGLVGRFRL